MFITGHMGRSKAGPIGFGMRQIRNARAHEKSPDFNNQIVAALEREDAALNFWIGGLPKAIVRRQRIKAAEIFERVGRVSGGTEYLRCAELLRSEKDLVEFVPNGYNGYKRPE